MIRLGKPYRWALILVLVLLVGYGWGSAHRLQTNCYACEGQLGQDHYCTTCYTDLIDALEDHPVIEEEYVFSGGGVRGGSAE